MGPLMRNELSYGLDSLAVDVFSLIEESAVVESLTGGHGMTELAASCPCTWDCGGSCSRVPENP
jgi:hypothetical protein